MERETKKHTTPSGKEFEVKTYLTARERNELRSVYLENVSVNAETAQPSLGALSGALLEKVEKKILELVVASFDGSGEGILERLENAAHPQSAEDYDFVVAEAGKIGNFKPAK